MATYSFKCGMCDNKLDATRAVGDNRPPVCQCGTTMNRDLRREWDSQEVHIPVHMSAKNTSNKSDFLPSAKDFEAPGDSDGSKGMKEWKDTHKLKGSTWI